MSQTMWLPVLIAAVICSELCPQAAALIPTICTHNVSNPVSVCCPTPPGSHVPCGGKGRGQCTRILPHKQYETMHPVLAADDRVLWPTRFFQFGCECDARYWGFDCGECFFGWKGPKCDQRDIRVRQNIFTLSPKEQAQYKEMTKIMRKKISPYSVLIERHANGSDPINRPKFSEATVHYWLVAVHRYASRKTMVDSPQACKKFGKFDLNHRGQGFVTWHRYYTMMLERELHKIAVEVYGWHEFALPYWDWTDATWCEVCHNELVGSPGECDENGQRLHSASPFVEWDEFCSQPKTSSSGQCVGCHTTSKFKKLNRQWKSLSFPTSAEVEYGLNLPLYSIPGEFNHSPLDVESCSFSRYLEGHCGPKEFVGTTGTLHNKVHDSVQGSFCCSGTAPNDPIFFLHHSQISRIVHMWQLCHGQSVQAMSNIDTVPGHSRQDYMVGFYPPIRHEEVFTDSESLGYTYDTLEFGDKVRERLIKQGLIPKPTLQHFMTCKSGFLHPQFVKHRHHFEPELQVFLRANADKNTMTPKPRGIEL